MADPLQRTGFAGTAGGAVQPQPAQPRFGPAGLAAGEQHVKPLPGHGPAEAQARETASQHQQPTGGLDICCGYEYTCIIHGCSSWLV